MGPGNNNSNQVLIEKLEAIVVDDLTEIENDVGRSEFRKKALKAWLPTVAAEFLNAASVRASKVTDLIEKRNRYHPLLSEAVFEKAYADCLTAWCWGKDGQIGDESSRLRNMIRSVVELFVAGIGGETVGFVNPQPPLQNSDNVVFVDPGNS